MSGHVLSLFEDRFAATGHAELSATPRVLYVLEGDVQVSSTAGLARVAGHAAWHGAAACSVTAGERGATLLRFELTRGRDAGAPRDVRPFLVHPIALDAGHAYLMRCDRVDFAPGGEAMPHGHRGGGIRRLLEGALEVRIGGRAGRLMRPGNAWFESGVEPVHAIASRDTATSFVRVSILPREIRGRSSIVYVDPAHGSVKPRQYTVHVDEPIELP